MTESYRNILIATDGSPGAKRAFEAALAIAVAVRAKLTIVTVVEKDQSAGASSGNLQDHTSRFVGPVEELASVARQAGVKRVFTALESGLGYSRILHLVERDDFDLAVVGAHGWGGETAGLGDIAAHVAKFATCDVLVVR